MRAYLLAAGWTLLILAACTLPGTDLPSIDLDLSYDKLAHFVLFFGLVWLWLRALPRDRPHLMIWVLLLSISYGILLEFYQGWLPFDRSPDPFDALANAAGALAGLAVHEFRRRRTS